MDLTYISSKPSPFFDHKRKTEFYVDFTGYLDDSKTQNTIKELEKHCSQVMVTGTPEVPYFPTHIMQLDNIGKKLLGEGDGI